MTNLLTTKNLNNIFLFLLVLFFYSCSDKSKTNLSVYRALASSLNSSNTVITRQNLFYINELEKRLADQATKQEAANWLPKALIIQKNSNDMFDYIDSLKDELIQESSLPDNKNIFREDDINAVSNLFDKEGKGEESKQRLLDFESNLLTIDPEMTSTFKNIINTTIRISDPSENPQKTFTETFFNNIPTAGALAVLTKFQNNVKIMENELITFCANKIPS